MVLLIVIAIFIESETNIAIIIGFSYCKVFKKLRYKISGSQNNIVLLFIAIQRPSKKNLSWHTLCVSFVPRYSRNIIENKMKTQ